MSPIDPNDPILNAPIPQLDVARGFDVDFSLGGGRQQQNVNQFCPFHNEDPRTSKPSCSVSITGLFHCQACGAKGTVVDFYAHKMSITKEAAQADLEGRTPGLSGANSVYPAPAHKDVPMPVQKGLNKSLPDRCHANLLIDADTMKYLLEKRGLKTATLERYKIGKDEYRITIPEFDHGRLKNIRRYDPTPSGNAPKMVSHIKGDGSPGIWPDPANLDLLPDGAEVFFLEGEWDTALARQEEFEAYTRTGSCRVWRDEWTDLFKRFRMRFIYDVNDNPDDIGESFVGQKMMRKHAEIMQDAGAPDVKVIDLPLPEKYIGGDVTNWFVDERRTAKDLRELVDATGVYDRNAPTPWVEPERAATPTSPTDAPAYQDKDTPNGSTAGASATTGTPSSNASGVDTTKIAPFVTLYDAADAQYFYQKVRMRCLVAGKGSAPFLVPRTVTIETIGDDNKKEVYTKEFGPWDGAILSLVNCTTRQQKAALKQLFGIPADAMMNVSVEDTMTLEEVFLIPAIDHERDQGPYTVRRCFACPRGLETNRVYDFEGYTLPDPNTQASTHIIVTAKPAESNVESFRITADMHNTLKRVFQSEDVYGKMEDIANEMAGAVTRIHGRTDLHIAVDLVYHSPLQFDFDGVRLRKGWLEALIIGDTRTGKGYVTEGLARHYGLGEVISGENLTLAGLIGGVQHVGDRWTLVWGKLPLNDKRLVIIDECGSLSQGDIAKMSRIRSEGVAEITKIISEKTTSRTRLIWLANPRAQQGALPRMIADYNYGIECVPELIGAAEDIARFDFVLVVAQSEVKSEVINAHYDAPARPRYISELCRDLVMWAWSRRPEQIIFADGVVEFTLRAAKSLGSQFSPKVCLIQSEDVRHKIARIACAVAARTYSTDDGTNLIVKQEHVEFAYNFLHHIYSKACCGYLQLSAAEAERNELRNEAEIIQAMDEFTVNGNTLPDLVDGLLEHRVITLRDLGDYANLDFNQSREFLSRLVRLKCIVKEYTGYVKRPAFKNFLRKYRVKLNSHQDPNVTMEPDNDDLDLASDGAYLTPASPTNEGLGAPQGT